MAIKGRVGTLRGLRVHLLEILEPQLALDGHCWWGVQVVLLVCIILIILIAMISMPTLNETDIRIGNFILLTCCLRSSLEGISVVIILSTDLSAGGWFVLSSCYLSPWNRIAALNGWGLLLVNIPYIWGSLRIVSVSDIAVGSYHFPLINCFRH